MEAQEFLISSIQDIIPPAETPDSIKHLSRTDLIEIQNYPAVIVTEEPYDYNQETGQNAIITRRQNCNVSIVVQSVNVNEMTEDSYKFVKGKLKILTDDVIAAILGKVPTEDKISNVRFGRAEVFDGKIKAVPVMWNLLPVEIILVN